MLLALTFSDTIPKNSIVFLTESEFFKRKYSSVYRVLKNYYCRRDTANNNRIILRRKERKKITKYLTSLYTRNSKRNVYALDTTNHYRSYSSKGIDRKNVRSKNNRLSEAGYEYSVLCNLKENDWSIPISIARVGSSDNKYDIGVSQILDTYSCKEKDSVTISVGDTAYSNCGYIEPLYNKDSLISLTRDRKNRAIYRVFSGDQKKIGRKRCYGERINLTEANAKVIPDIVTEFANTSKKEVVTKVVLKEYKNLLVKGRKTHSMKDKPVNYVKAEVYNLEGNKIYNNDLLICVSGKHRNQLTAKEVYSYYKSRFDIEHFFKFAKSKLRFDKLQTTDPEIDEDYCMFAMIAYNHLYHLKDYISPTKDYGWYRSKGKDKTPAVVYRSISELKNEFKDITTIPKKRGIPDHRNIRKFFSKKPKAPVISKNSNKNNVEISIKVPFGKSRKFAKTAFNVNQLDEQKLIAKISALHQKIITKPEQNIMQLE